MSTKPSSSKKRVRFCIKSVPSRWSQLNSDILEDISKRCCESHLDVQRMRAVCKGWRASLTPPVLPNQHREDIIRSARLTINDFPFGKYHGRGHFSLKMNKVYSVQPLVKFKPGTDYPTRSSRTWFVKLEECLSGNFRFKHPLSLLPIKTFGGSGGSTNPLKVLNLLYYNVREVAREYRLQYNRGDNYKRPQEVEEFKKIEVNLNEDNGSFMIMALFGNGKLIVWKMGEDKWVRVDEEYHYRDIAYHKGKFYAVDQSRRLITVDSTSLEVSQVVAPTYGFGEQEAYARLVHLVKVQGELYLINRYDGDFLDVFRYDEGLGEWDYDGEWSGDWVMFAGDNGLSFSLSAEEFGGCKENCVYFDDSCFASVWADYQVDDNDFQDFNFIDFPNTFLPLRCFSPYNCKLFWPPPKWIKKSTTGN